jgi:hypothetical protein
VEAAGVPLVEVTVTTSFVSAASGVAEGVGSALEEDERVVEELVDVLVEDEVEVEEEAEEEPEVVVEDDPPEMLGMERDGSKPGALDCPAVAVLDAEGVLDAALAVSGFPTDPVSFGSEPTLMATGLDG